MRPEPLYSLSLAPLANLDFLISSLASNLPNFAVWIEIDGQAVPVYSQTDWEDSKIATGYIESEEGKHFVVRFADLRTSPPQESYSARVFVDGE